MSLERLAETLNAALDWDNMEKTSGGTMRTFSFELGRQGYRDTATVYREMSNVLYEVAVDGVRTPAKLSEFKHAVQVLLDDIGGKLPADSEVRNNGQHSGLVTLDGLLRQAIKEHAAQEFELPQYTGEAKGRGHGGRAATASEGPKR